MNALKYATRKPVQTSPEKEPEFGARYALRRWIAGKPLPTELEIAEGRSYRRYTMEPDNEELRREHIRAWNALQKLQSGSMGLLRCDLCRTTQWGRLKTDTCPVCGCQSISYD